MMKRLLVSMIHDESGQDLVEYLLMAGFVAVAAGALMQDVTFRIQAVMSKIVVLDISSVRIVCAVLSVLFLGIIVLRRKKDTTE